jgi:hypothetical protein
MHALAVRERVTAVLRDLATELATLTPEQFGSASEFLGRMSDMVEAARETLGSRVKAQVLEHGTQKTDKGTKAWVVGGYELVAIPTRTGTDPKRLEARLRMKGIDPSRYMDMKITYAVSETKLQQALTDGAITAADLSLCKYDLNYRLDVKPVNNE